MKFLRPFGTLFCSAVLAGVLSCTAFAGDISVKIDDKPVKFTDVKPIIENDRTYVPFRAIFEQMHADVSWNEDERSIVAVRGDTTVRFEIGKEEMNITDNGITTTKIIDASPFIKNDRTYVPIRFASEALGACVDWDNNTRTVLIVDVDNLMAGYKDKFTHMDDYINFISSDKNTKLDGSFNLSMQYKTAMGNIPVSVNGTLSGVKNNTGSEVYGTAVTDVQSIKSAIISNEGENAVSPDIDNMLNSLSSSNYRAIINNSDKMLYLSGGLFTPLGLENGSWAGISFNEFNTGDISIGNSKNFADYIAQSAQSVVIASTPDNTVASVKAFLDDALKAYGDESFTEDNGKFTLNQINTPSSCTISILYDTNKKVYQTDVKSTVIANSIEYKAESTHSANSYSLSTSVTGAKNADINFSLSANKSDGDIAPIIIPNGDITNININ